MLLLTYAEEEADVVVLNYAPGPIDTDMQFEARTYTADKELKDMFKGKSKYFSQTKQCHFWMAFNDMIQGKKNMKMYLFVVDMKLNQKLLTPEQSVAKLVELMRKNKFESGSHIDYYDV